MITKTRDGLVTWDADDFIEYHITGVDVNHKRFKRVCRRWEHARHYNIHRGTCWGVRADGTRVKLQEVYN